MVSWKRNRAQQFERERAPLPEIPLEAGAYLLDALQEIGLTCRPSAEIEIPLTWAEIDAYARTTGAVTEAWECRALRLMSQAYIQGRNEGTDPFSIPITER